MWYIPHCGISPSSPTTSQSALNFYPIVLEYLKQTISLASEAAFLDKLKEILAAQHTVNTVQSLLAQVSP